MTTAPCAACHMHFTLRPLGGREVVRFHTDQDEVTCVGSLEAPAEELGRWVA